MRFHSSILLGFICIGGDLHGEELRTFFDSVRARGRGGASSAAYLSDEATRLNPAALGEADGSDFQIRWAQFDGYIGDNAITTITDIIDIAQSDSNASAIIDTFSSKFGERQFGGMQLFPLGLRWGWFDLEPFLSSQNFVEIRVPTIPEFTMESKTSAGMNFGMGVPLGKTFLVGMNTRIFQRFEIGGTISSTDVLVLATDSSASFDDFIPTESASMLGVDLGAIWKPHQQMRFSLLIQDVGDTSALSDGSDNPAPIKQAINVGNVMRLAFGKWLNIDTHVEVRDLLNRQGLNYLRLINGGMEMGSSYFTKDNDIGLQLGLGEGYLSIGAFVDLWLARIAIANYGVETGTYPGQRQDRRWAMSLKSSVTF